MSYWNFDLEELGVFEGTPMSPQLFPVVRVDLEELGVIEASSMQPQLFPLPHRQQRPSTAVCSFFCVS